MNLSELEAALIDGGRLNCTHSGGDARVATVDNATGEQIVWLAAAHAEDALAYTNISLILKLSKKEMFGKDSLFPMYEEHSTASCHTSPIDRWVGGGYSFEAYYKNTSFVVELRGPNAKLNISEMAIASLQR